MPMTKLKKDGYGQIELNRVAWSRTGRIEAQCKLDPSEFPADHNGQIGKVAENGMLFAIIGEKRQLKKATAALAAKYPIGFNYSTEHMYDERLGGSYKHFYLHGGEDFLPRLGMPEAQDKFTLNTVCYNSDIFSAGLETVQEELTAGRDVFAGIASDGSGYWELVKVAPKAGPIARVIEVTDMPDGQPAVKLQMIKVI